VPSAETEGANGHEEDADRKEAQLPTGAPRSTREPSAETVDVDGFEENVCCRSRELERSTSPQDTSHITARTQRTERFELILVAQFQGASGRDVFFTRMLPALLISHLFWRL
jgi:hypothetical protein